MSFKKFLLISISFLVSISFVPAVSASESTSTNFSAQDQSISIGGGDTTSTNFELLQNIGENSTGESTSTNFILRSGSLYYSVAAATSATPAASPTSASGGGSPGIHAYDPPTPPSDGFRISINSDAATTESANVVVAIYGSPDVSYVLISENSDFGEALQVWYDPSFEVLRIPYQLSSGGDGKQLYAKFYTRFGASSETVSDSIIVSSAKEESGSLKGRPGIIDKIIDIISPFIPDVLKPKPKPPTTLIPKETPLVFRGSWYLLPRKPIREFALAPLPKDIANLAEKLPSIKKIFTEVGVKKLSDTTKLENIALKVPGLTKTVMPSASGSIPLSKLSLSAKQDIPQEVLFVRSPNELIDLETVLSLSSAGDVKQSVTALAGELIHLSVRPLYPARAIKGFLLLDSINRDDLTSHNPKKLMASLGYSLNKNLPKEILGVTEERLVLLEFEYADPDNDGVYTAHVAAPGIGGTYEVVTILFYQDPDLGEKELRLTVVVDPEGYVYEKIGNQELRISGAIVTLYSLNRGNSDYETWDAKSYGQENPQVTGVRGTYAFLAPPGEYYLQVDAPGYPLYKSKSFKVEVGNQVHINVELKPQYWWLKFINLQNVIFGIIILLLLYNFYRDKITKRLIETN